MARRDPNRYGRLMGNPTDERQLRQGPNDFAYQDEAYDDPEHLDQHYDASTQGLVDSITEGTISLPHSRDGEVLDLIADQHEIDEELRRIQATSLPSGLDVIPARRMLPRRYALNVNAGVTRLLQANHMRRYFIIVPDTTTGMDVYFGVDPVAIGGGNSVRINVAAATTLTVPQEWWHQGELYAIADTTTITVSTFTIVEFLAS